MLSCPEPQDQYQAGQCSQAAHSLRLNQHLLQTWVRTQACCDWLVAPMVQPRCLLSVQLVTLHHRPCQPAQPVQLCDISQAYDNSHCIAPSAADRWMCPGQQASLDCRPLVLECLMYSGVHLAMQLCKPCSWRLLARRLDASRTPATCACCTKWSRHARLASQLQSSWQMFLPIRYAGTLGRSPASTFVEWHVFQRCHYMQSAAHGTC